MKRAFARVLAALVLITVAGATVASPAHAASATDRPARAADVEIPYSVTHKQATVSGTSEVMWMLLLSGYVRIKGTLQQSSSDCYRVLTSLSPEPGGTEQARQCGPGTTAPFDVTYPFFGTRPPVYLYLCRGLDTSDCTRHTF